MGIIADFSEWQGTIDWSKVSELHKNGTLDGVILRVQAGYTHPDSKYEEYVAGCRQYSIPFGTYAYFKGISVDDAIKEAENALALTDKDSKCFGVDVEEVSMTDLVSGSQAFIDYLKSKGMVNVGLYSYKGFYDNHNLAAVKADWHWIAAYGVNDGQPHTDPQIAGESLWQFTSVAHLDGVNTNVDESKEIDFSFFGGKVTNIIPAKFLMQVRVLCDTDVRAEPSHTSGYIKDAHKDEIYNVIQIQNDWHQVALTDSTTGWIDGNNGQNLYWIDNPALKEKPQPQPQPVYHTVVSGDTVGKLAKNNGTTIDQIKAWNNLDSKYTIIVGKKIRVK